MQPAAKKQRVEEGGGKQKQQQGKKKKPPSPEIQVRMEIHAAARANDVGAALAALDRALEQGTRVAPDCYVSVLYLCSGGDAWERQLRSASNEGGAAGDDDGEARQQEQQAQQPAAAAGEGAAAAAAAAGAAAPADGGDPEAAPRAPQPSAEEVARRARALFAEMQASEGRLPLNEMCYTALARLAALQGDADRAFALAQEAAAAGIPPKLRSYTPALLAYAERGACDKAFEVDAVVTGQHRLDLGEPEFARLLQAAAAGGSWERAAGVLRRIGAELTALQPGTLARIRALFASPAASAAAGAGGGGAWRVEATTVSAEGRCSACGGQLAAVDLSPEEFETFASGIASIAERQERRPNDFQAFKAWLAERGPFGAVIDGANVALFGQNFEKGGFNFGQIRAVIDRLRAQHPDTKPLLLLHVGRTKSPQARTPEAQALLRELTAAGSFYITPAGSNDDWYWMYAAATAGGAGLLVSNDEMRDHIFQLLAPKYFLKWKQRHQLKYRFSAGAGLELDYPAPFTTCAQELPCGAWVFPGADGSWLCARRQPAEAGGDEGATA